MSLSQVDSFSVFVAKLFYLLLHFFFAKFVFATRMNYFNLFCIMQCCKELTSIMCLLALIVFVPEAGLFVDSHGMG